MHPNNRPADDEATRLATAFEVVHYVRIVGTRTVSQIRALSDIITRFHPPALTDLAESLDPDDRLLCYRMESEMET